MAKRKYKFKVEKFIDGYTHNILYHLLIRKRFMCFSWWSYITIKSEGGTEKKVFYSNSEIHEYIKNFIETKTKK